MRRQRVLLAFVVVPLVSIACGSDAAGSPPVATRSAVAVGAAGCSLIDSDGLGILAGPGQVLTAAHVVAGGSEVWIDVDGQRHPAHIDVIDTEVDLALLAVDIDAPTLDIGRAPLDGPVWLAAPNGSVATVLNRRLLVTIEDIYLAGQHERQAIEIGLGVERGTSGAGVVDAENRLVGVVYGTSRDRAAAFALDADELERVISAADGRPAAPVRCP